MKEHPLDYRTIQSELKYEGVIVHVKLDRIILESGKEVFREVVTHKPAVAIAPLDDDGNVLLVRQYRHPAREKLLEVPAGLIEEGEEPDVAAMRELQEEVGFASNNLRLLGGFWSSPGFTDEYMYCYLASNLVKRELPGDDDEEITTERIPLEEVHKLIKLGEIQDAKTIALLLMIVDVF